MDVNKKAVILPKMLRLNPPLTRNLSALPFLYCSSQKYLCLSFSSKFFNVNFRSTRPPPGVGLGFAPIFTSASVVPAISVAP